MVTALTGRPVDKPQPHLVRLLRPRPHQQAITGQRLGIGVVRRLASAPGTCAWPRRPSSSVGWAGPAGSTRLRRQSPAPTWAGSWPAGSAVAPFFFRAYAGSGLVIQCLARFQDTRKRRRATRMASSLTSRGVSPWAKLTSAASCERPPAGGLAERPGTLVQQRPQGLAGASVEDGRDGVGAGRLRLQRGETALVERMQRVADRLLGAAQVVRNRGGRPGPRHWRGGSGSGVR